MIITTKQFLSSLWLVVALIVATLLAVALPGTLHAQTSTLVTTLATAQTSIQVEGYASWYNLGRHGAKTASGERYDHKALTAAHPSLPFDTMVKVTNIETNTFVVVRINDRMRSGAKHIIDLSGAAAEKIGLFKSGTAEVRLSPVEAQSLALATLGRNPSAKTQDIEMGPSAPATKAAPAKTSVPQIKTVSSSTSNGSVSARNSSSNVEMYTLQIGSFSTHARAKILADQFNESWIARIDVNGEVSFRVYFSRYEQEKPARIAQNDLWTKGQDSFLRKVAS